MGPLPPAPPCKRSRTSIQPVSIFFQEETKYISWVPLFLGIFHQFCFNCFLCMHLFSYFRCCQMHSFTQNFLKYITGGKQKIGPIYKMAAIPSVWILFLILGKLQQHFVWQFWITSNFCSVWIFIGGKVFVCRATTPGGEINNKMNINNINKTNNNNNNNKNLQSVDIYWWQSVCVWSDYSQRRRPISATSTKHWSPGTSWSPHANQHQHQHQQQHQQQ